MTLTDPVPPSFESRTRTRALARPLVAALMLATAATTGPTTPAVSQVALLPGGGTSSNMQRRQAVWPGIMVWLIP
ncbi:MAG: hypothetical protein HC807_06155 [Gammaproteobacteria bacterium]|nr:hypothetical protein [Gammaproteobacteria bacterium]